MQSRPKSSVGSRLRPLQFPAILCLIFWTLAIILWRKTGNAFFIFDLGYIGTSLGVGTGLYAMLPRKKKPTGRRLAQFLVGVYMVGFLGLIVLQNMQVEGLLFYLFTGIFSGAIIHYSIAKIFGPLLFGRGFCGWGCWTAMIVDLLPYDRSKGWVRGPWCWLRYVHFALSVGLVASLVFLFGYRPHHWTPLWWLLTGNMLYYAAAIPLAHLLQDNRAFCKYLCPVAVVMKRTRVMNQLHVVALNEGLRRKKALWRPAGRSELESLRLAPWAGRRRQDLLDLLDQLTPKIQQLSKALEDEVEKRPVTRRLMTHPGVGPLTALAFELVIGTPERFHCGKQIAIYVGLVPTEESSGDRRRLGHISKQGNVLLRFLLVEAALVTVRREPRWRSTFFHLAMRRGRKIAKVAMARKMAVHLYWMWRQGRDYAEFEKLGSHAGEPGNPHGVQ